MKKNLLLEYSENLAVSIARLCQENKLDSNIVFQIKKSSSSVFANITEAQYPQGLADMHSKFEIARKECAETEGRLKLLFSTKAVDELRRLYIYKHTPSCQIVVFRVFRQRKKPYRFYSIQLFCYLILTE